MNETRKWAAELLAPHYGNDSAALIAGVVALAACVEGEAATPLQVGGDKRIRWSDAMIDQVRVLTASGHGPTAIAAVLSAEVGRHISGRAVALTRNRYGIPSNATAEQLRAIEAARAAKRRNGTASA